MKSENRIVRKEVSGYRKSLENMLERMNATLLNFSVQWGRRFSDYSRLEKLYSLQNRYL